MSIHRLGALLRHSPPDEAYSIAVGDHRPSGLDPAGPRRCRRARRLAAGRPIPVAREHLGALHPTRCAGPGSWVGWVSGTAPRRSAAASGRVRPGQSRPARRAPCRDRRYAQCHGCRPRHGDHARPAVGRGRRARRLGAGPWHRRLRPSRCAARRRMRSTDRRRRLRPRCRVPPRARGAVGSRRREGPAVVRGAAGNPARGLSVPACAIGSSPRSPRS